MIESITNLHPTVDIPSFNVNHHSIHITTYILTDLNILFRKVSLPINMVGSVQWNLCLSYINSVRTDTFEARRTVSTGCPLESRIIAYTPKCTTIPLWVTWRLNASTPAASRQYDSSALDILPSGLLPTKRCHKFKACYPATFSTTGFFPCTHPWSKVLGVRADLMRSTCLLAWKRFIKLQTITSFASVTSLSDCSNYSNCCSQIVYRWYDQIYSSDSVWIGWLFNGTYYIALL